MFASIFCNFKSKQLNWLKFWQPLSERLHFMEEIWECIIICGAISISFYGLIKLLSIPSRPFYFTIFSCEKSLIYQWLFHVFSGYDHLHYTSSLFHFTYSLHNSQLYPHLSDSVNCISWGFFKKNSIIVLTSVTSMTLIAASCPVLVCRPCRKYKI